MKKIALNVELNSFMNLLIKKHILSHLFFVIAIQDVCEMLNWFELNNALSIYAQNFSPVK